MPKSSRSKLAAAKTASRTRLDNGGLKNRIHDCRGAIALAITGILDGDVASIDAAVGCLALTG